MAPKLGEILIAGKHISPSDLKKALDAQLVFGGRLGTNLIDLGLLDEQTLTRVLQEQRRVQVATPRMLEEADPKAIAMIPRRLAERHQCVPFAIDEHHLKVAMIDPTDLIALDELAFATGRKIVPFIAPEIRVLGHLEQHYDVQRPVRYVRLAEAGERRETPPRAAPSAEQEALAPPLQEYEGGDQSVPLALGEDRARVMSQPGTGSVTGGLANLDEILGDMGVPATRPGEQLPAVGLDAVAALLAEADTREDIGEALLSFGRKEFTRVFAWLIQRDRALGWLAHLPGISTESARRWARRAQVPLTGEPSVLADVVSSRRYYLGELPGRKADEALAQLFGEPRAREVALLPVLLGEQVVIVLQGDRGGDSLGGFDLKALRAGCQKASLAMEVLLLRARIRQAQSG